MARLRFFFTNPKTLNPIIGLLINFTTFFSLKLPFNFTKFFLIHQKCIKRLTSFKKRRQSWMQPTVKRITRSQLWWNALNYKFIKKLLIRDFILSRRSAHTFLYFSPTVHDDDQNKTENSEKCLKRNTRKLKTIARCSMATVGKREHGKCLAGWFRNSLLGFSFFMNFSDFRSSLLNYDSGESGALLLTQNSNWDDALVH